MHISSQRSPYPHARSISFPKPDKPSPIHLASAATSHTSTAYLSLTEHAFSSRLERQSSENQGFVDRPCSDTSSPYPRTGQTPSYFTSLFFSFILNRIGRPTCSTSMRIVTSHIRPPSHMQNHWRFRYPLTTHLTILTYHLEIWNILTAPTFQGIMARNPLHQSYAVQSAAT